MNARIWMTTLAVLGSIPAAFAGDASVSMKAPAKVALGEKAKLEVTAVNGGKKTVVREPMLDASSFEFEVQFESSPKSRYTAYHPTSYEPSNVKGQDLDAGAKLGFEHFVNLPVAGTWTFTPVWNGGDAPVRGEATKIVVEPKDGATRLLWRMETKPGVMDVEFWPDVAPATTIHIANNVARGYYDGTPFHRVMKGFMIQGGDPKGTGGGGPGYSIQAEFNDRKHEPGVLSMARVGDPMEATGAMPGPKFANSAGSQFFLCHASPASLNGKYTVFGKVMRGLEIVDAIATAPVKANMRGEMSTPIDVVKMNKATLVPDAAATAEKKEEKPVKTPPAAPTKPDGASQEGGR